MIVIMTNHDCDYDYDYVQYDRNDRNDRNDRKYRNDGKPDPKKITGSGES